MKPVFIAAFLLLSLNSVAQQSFRYKVGDTISEAQLNELKRDQMRRNSIYIGMALPAFSGITNSGKQISEQSMKGNVYLLAFWQTDCNCFDVSNLDRFKPLEEQHKDFHVLSVLPDTAYMYLCKPCSTPFNYVVTKSYDEARALRLKNGLPSYMVVNRAGIIVKIISGMELRELNDESYTAFSNSLEELLRL